MKIAVDQLKAAGASCEQFDLFIELFGEEVLVTQDACARYAGQFNWDWASENLLPQPAWEAYEKATQPAREVRDTAQAVAFAQAAATCGDQMKPISDMRRGESK